MIECDITYKKKTICWRYYPEYHILEGDGNKLLIESKIEALRSFVLMRKKGATVTIKK